MTPLGAAVDASGTRAYVANQVAPIGTVSVIDTTQNGVVGTVTVGAGPSGVAAKLPGDRVYVTNRDDKTVSVIDTTTLAVVATVDVGNNPLGVAVESRRQPGLRRQQGQQQRERDRHERGRGRRRPSPSATIRRTWR